MLLALSLAHAQPDDDVAIAAAEHARRTQATDAFNGLGAESALRGAWQLGDCNASPFTATLWRAECERSASNWLVGGSVRPTGTLSFGDAEPQNLGGDAEPGMISARAGVRGAAWVGPFTLRAAPSAGLDVLPDAQPSLQMRELWLGADTGTHWLGVGRQDRWMGPGHAGTLLLSDNAVAPWMVNGGLEGRLPDRFARIGRFRAEVGVGVLGEERDDVANPGLLMMDLRYAPVPYVEIGLSRMSIFGGEDRPAVDVGQLLVPSEPHIYGDPDKELADQNEMASLHLSVNLPLGGWVGGPVRYVAGWWEYGGEDMIVRYAGDVPYPALAGVGNLYGGEVAVGPVVVTGEYTRLMDDYFRWYVGHRVYHSGFTQNQRVLGQFGGPDSETISGAATLWGESWRGRAWGDFTRRVGVVEARGDNVFVMQTEEQRWRAGVGGDILWRKLWFQGGYTLARTEGRNFVAGTEAWEHRVTVALGAGPEWSFGSAR